jgi:hypothetical protein
MGGTLLFSDNWYSFISVLTIIDYNTERSHQGKRCQGTTPMETFLENAPLAKEKILDMKADKLALAA